jgi:hypothetical protein
MSNLKRSCAVAAIALLLVASSVGYAGIPDPVKNRFKVGDPQWREFPVRENLKENYDKLWQTVVNAILENNFDIATMEKESGYIRTTMNEGIVKLKNNWYYKIQVSVKLVVDDSGGKKSVSKIRLQVAGDLVRVDNKNRIKDYYRGYDEVVLDTLLQDLKSKLG